MYGDRRVHRTERSKWRLTFRRLVADALSALQADNPGSAQQAIAEMVDLACEMKGYDYFHSDDPVEPRSSCLGPPARSRCSVMTASRCSPGARRSSSSAGRRTAAGRDGATVGCRKRKQPCACRSPSYSPRRTCGGRSSSSTWTRWTRPDGPTRSDPAPYGSFDETRFRRHERAKDLAAWHGMLLDRFAGTPEDELLDRLAASPALAGPELTFLRARIAERRGAVGQAATLVTESLKELPGHRGTWTSL